MKATFAKALALVFVLALTLTGCNLIEIDAKMQADEDIAKIDEKYEAVVATYTGGEVSVAEAVSDFNTSYIDTVNMYSYFGLSVGQDQIYELIQTALEDVVSDEIAAAHYDADHSLSEEQLEEVESTAQSTYETQLESAKSSAAGDDEEDRAENARVLLRSSGSDYDSLYASGLRGAKADAMHDLLRDEITEITDEELQTAYDDKVSEQQGSFTDGTSFESAMSDGTEIVCWKPDGYRTVKHILIKPADDTLSTYTTAVSDLETKQDELDSLRDELDAANDDTAEDGERSPEEIQTEIDAGETELSDLQSAVDTAAQACLDEVKATTDEIYSRLEAGDAFEDLIEEYGEDPGMQNEPTKSSGYYVSTESQNWEVNFRDAAMALNQVGDYTTEPVVSGSGVHIIQYTGDVAGGEVPLEDVHDELYDETLETRKEDYATETIEGWVTEANPSYDADTFQSIVLGAEE